MRTDSPCRVNGCKRDGFHPAFVHKIGEVKGQEYLCDRHYCRREKASEASNLMYMHDTGKVIDLG